MLIEKISVGLRSYIIGNYSPKRYIADECPCSTAEVRYDNDFPNDCFTPVPVK